MNNQKNIQKYYDNTKSDKPRENIKYFIEIEPNKGNAIELGCGVGNDVVYLIKNKWKVLAIDREDVYERISKRLNVEELKRFRFQKQDFEEIKLEKTDLIVANFSLPFCNKNKFDELWNKIKEHILPNGYFVGNLFGIRDEWNLTKKDMTFLTKEDVKKLFDEFEIIRFHEIEKDERTGMGKMKHWHIFDIIAKKK